MRHHRELRASVTAAIMLMTLSLGIGCAAPKATLESLCDDVGVVHTRYAAASFAESCALLESTIRQALLHTETPQADAVRRRFTLQSTVTPPGSLPFSAATPDLTCTIREFVRQFAATWKVAASITGDQIIFSKTPVKAPAAQ